MDQDELKVGEGGKIVFWGECNMCMGVEARGAMQKMGGSVLGGKGG